MTALRIAGLRGTSSTLLVYTTLGLLQRALSLILIPFVTRAMSVPDYGAVAVIAAGAALLAALVGGGVEQGVFRWSVPANASDGGDGIVRVAHRWLFRVCPAIGLFVALALWFLPGRILLVPDHIWAIEAVAASLLAPLTYFALPQLRAQQRLRAFSVVSASSILSLLGSKVLLVVVLGFGVTGWAVSDLIAGVVGYGLAIALTRPPRGRVTMDAIRSTARFTGPLLPHVLSFWALSSLTRPLMATALPLSVIAVYSAGYSAAAVGVMVLAEINRAVLPEYAVLDLRRPRPRHLALIRMQVLAAFLCAALVAALAPVYGTIVLPPHYHAAIAVTTLLAVMPLAYGLYLIPTNVVIQTFGRTQRAWQASLSGTVAVFVLTVPLGIAFGSVGVALVNDGAYVVMAAVSAVLLGRLVGAGRILHAVRRLRPSLVIPLGCVLLLGRAATGTTGAPGWSLLVSGCALCVLGTAFGLRHRFPARPEPA